jgi:hypothetical protein
VRGLLLWLGRRLRLWVFLGLRFCFEVLIPEREFSRCISSAAIASRAWRFLSADWIDLMGWHGGVDQD